MDIENIPKKELAGKTVVITGASSGIGRAAVEAFALENCNIILAARGVDALEEATNLARDLGAVALSVPTDVSVDEEVKLLSEKALELNGRIDIWVNNAGVMASGKFEEIPMDIHEQVIKTNLMGYMHGAYHAINQFKKQGDGILINNISIGGFMPAPYSAVYSATKFGIKGMMECLRGELSGEPHIHICNLYPQIQRSTGNMHSAKYSGLDFKIPPFAADPRDTAAEMVKSAKNLTPDKFPDTTSFLMKNIYGLFPKAIMNTASAGMRMMMKVKDAPPDEGNVLQPSKEPHRIYGETMLPVPSKKTKNIALGVLGAGLAYFILNKNKKS